MTTDVLLEWLIKSAIILFVLVTAVAYLTFLERKVMSWIQLRIGPNRVGPWGLLQPLADGVKMIFKEDIIPTEANRWLYVAAPAISLIPALMTFIKPPLFLVFIVYYIASLAECNRTPFDLPEAESELVAGYHTEYSSMKFVMFQMAEYINLITASSIAVTLFFGGYIGPKVNFYPWLGLVYFTVKVLALIVLAMWIRFTLPRFRYDQLMRFGSKFLLPPSIINATIH